MYNKQTLFIPYSHLDSCSSTLLVIMYKNNPRLGYESRSYELCLGCSPSVRTLSSGRTKLVAVPNLWAMLLPLSRRGPVVVSPSDTGRCMYIYQTQNRGYLRLGWVMVTILGVMCGIVHIWQCGRDQGLKRWSWRKNSHLSKSTRGDRSV